MTGDEVSLKLVLKIVLIKKSSTRFTFTDRDIKLGYKKSSFLKLYNLLLLK